MCLPHHCYHTTTTTPVLPHHPSNTTRCALPLPHHSGNSKWKLEGKTDWGNLRGWICVYHITATTPPLPHLSYHTTPPTRLVAHCRYHTTREIPSGNLRGKTHWGNLRGWICVYHITATTPPLPHLSYHTTPPTRLVAHCRYHTTREIPSGNLRGKTDWGNLRGWICVYHITATTPPLPHLSYHTTPPTRLVAHCRYHTTREIPSGNLRGKTDWGNLGSGFVSTTSLLPHHHYHTCPTTPPLQHDSLRTAATTPLGKFQVET